MISFRTYIVGLDAARELHRLRAPQSAHYYWIVPVNPDRNPIAPIFMPLDRAQSRLYDNEGDDYDMEMLAAYTLDELGAIMERPFFSGRDESGYYAALASETGFVDRIFRSEVSELDARTQLALYVFAARSAASTPNRKGIDGEVSSSQYQHFHNRFMKRA